MAVAADLLRHAEQQRIEAAHGRHPAHAVRPRPDMLDMGKRTLNAAHDRRCRPAGAAHLLGADLDRDAAGAALGRRLHRGGELVGVEDQVAGIDARLIERHQQAGEEPAVGRREADIRCARSRREFILGS